MSDLDPATHGCREVVGGAIALNLLFGTPLLVGGTITAVVAFALLGFQSKGHRPYETVITALLAVIFFGFLYDIAVAGFEPSGVLAGTQPRFEGADSVLLAAGMLGATVMPHAIYLHSALTSDRYHRRMEWQRLSLLRSQRVDVIVAMTIAGLMNLALLVIAASVLGGDPNAASIEGADSGIETALGRAPALFLAIALLASGFAASSVGTLSGQVIMEGFLRRRIPLAVRRFITLAPALLVLAAGVDPSRALVLSQVALSLGIPFALVPLVMLTSRPRLMGGLVNRPVTTVAASLVAAVIIVLNVTLLWLTLR